MGRPRKPEHLKLAHSAEPGGHKARPGFENPTSEPQPKALTRAQAMKPPRSLAKYPHAKRAWKELAPEIFDMGIFGSSDRKALEVLCKQIEIYEVALEQMLEQSEQGANTPGRVVLVGLGAMGGDIANPLVNVLMKARDRINRGLVAFGLTPQARAGVSKLATEAGGSEWEGL